MNLALSVIWISFLRSGPSRFVSYEDIMYAILSNNAEVLILSDMLLLQEKHTPGSIFRKSLSTITRYSSPLMYQKMHGVAAMAQCRETTLEDLI